MQLNTIKPATGSKHYKRRVGRGIGSGIGKTAGRGHKGQKSRAGGYHKVGFEGGQMPLQRRLPKRGFKSVTLKAVGLIPELSRNVKVILSGSISRKVTLKGVGATVGAKAAIEAAGGSVL